MPGDWDAAKFLNDIVHSKGQLKASDLVRLKDEIIGLRETVLTWEALLGVRDRIIRDLNTTIARQSKEIAVQKAAARLRRTRARHG